jgi:hypothetical protein
MKTRVLVLIVTLGWPAVGAAQSTSTDTGLLAQAIAAARDVRVSDQAPRAQTPPPEPPAAPEPVEPRRRGSMVGYIDDAVVASHLRVRFDAAYGGERADRAEFFYAKCGCYKGLATAIPPAYDPDAPGPGPAVLTDYDFRQVYLQGEYAFTPRLSGFVELPFRWLSPQSFLAGSGTFPSQSGLSDIRAGVKVAVSSTADHTVTAALRAEFPSGDAGKGLGNNHGTLVPELLYYQSISDRVAVESQVGYWRPLSGSAGVPTAGSDQFWGSVFFYGIGPSIEAYRSPSFRLAPVVELVGWHVLGGFQTEVPGTADGVAVPVDGLNIVNLKVGARAVFQDRTSLYVGYGRALTSASWYDDIVRIEVRYQF